MIQARITVRRIGNTETNIDIHLKLGAQAALNWLPQDTILYNGCRAQRFISAEIAASAKLLLAETLVFGRTAMGERLVSGLFRDEWRVRRDGNLVFAENILLRDDTFQMLSDPAIAGDANAAFTLIYVAPSAEDQLKRVRQVIQSAQLHCAASAWNGLLVIRGLSSGVEPVRYMMSEIVPTLQCGTLPRVWWS